MITIVLNADFLCERDIQTTHELLINVLENSKVASLKEIGDEGVKIVIKSKSMMMKRFLPADGYIKLSRQYEKTKVNVLCQLHKHSIAFVISYILITILFESVFVIFWLKGQLSTPFLLLLPLTLALIVLAVSYFDLWLAASTALRIVFEAVGEAAAPFPKLTRRIEAQRGRHRYPFPKRGQ